MTLARPAAIVVTAVACLACAPAGAVDCAVSVSGVAFGVYDPTIATATDAVGAVSVRCFHTGGGASRASYAIALSAGNSGAFGQRQLRAGPARLNYNLFSGATRAQVWGDGTQGSVTVGGSLLVNPGSLSSNGAVHPVYGRIPAQQPASTGSYSDAILITLTF
ncbi:MAG: spore coat U domain-containing protein [Steroidobacteraceae bacterium]|jgi:spore coat protein U-like protein|nr:spore coat U domain-containing protein [Steroidobacteraceae bacterium]